jgi:hypothetical protein
MFSFMIERDVLTKSFYDQKTGGEAFMHKICFLILWLAILLSGCTPGEQPVKNGGESHVDLLEQPDMATIPLEYEMIPVEPLKTGVPAQDWVLSGILEIPAAGTQPEARLHLYLEDPEGLLGLTPLVTALQVGGESCAFDGDGISGPVHALLEHGGIFYEVGLVGNYGLDLVFMAQNDWTLDGEAEIEIMGALGASYVEMRLIAFDPARGGWNQLLMMGSPQRLDLDEDGVPEILAVSAGSLPGYADLYRWRENHFEKASIANATNSHFVDVLKTEDGWRFETGISENGKTTGTRIFKYESDVLVQVAPAK